MLKQFHYTDEISISLICGDYLMKHIFQMIARTETADDGLRSVFSSMKNEGKLLPCSTSVGKLIDILNSKKFKSGDHVDYYDE